MTIYFTSDTHFGHKNIIEYCNRPFRDVDHMDEELIKRWNQVVRPNDTVYHLGDFSFREPKRYTDRLNGHINLILGNHDWSFHKKNQLIGFSNIYDVFKLKYQGRRFWLAHYAHRVWPHSHKGSIHLYGHSHGELEDAGNRSMDVGVDCHDYRPISIEKVIKILEPRDYTYHHKRRES